MHTPGPWVKDYGCTTGHIKSVATKDDSRTPTVCRYDVKTISLTDEERQANAHLIAAAPDLLEALTNCLWLADCLSGNTDDIGNKIIAEARQAIKKAKGEL